MKRTGGTGKKGKGRRLALLFTPIDQTEDKRVQDLRDLDGAAVGDGVVRWMDLDLNVVGAAEHGDEVGGEVVDDDARIEKEEMTRHTKRRTESILIGNDDVRDDRAKTGSHHPEAAAIGKEHGGRRTTKMMNRDRFPKRRRSREREHQHRNSILIEFAPTNPGSRQHTHHALNI